MGVSRRLTLAEAARELGISKEGVRKRVKRGPLRSDKAPDGRVYVYLPLGGDASPPGAGPGPGPGQDPRDELVEELRDRVRSLERQLDAERDANRENRRIIAGLIDRVPELEAPTPPPATPGAPQTATETPGG